MAYCAMWWKPSATAVDVWHTQRWRMCSLQRLDWFSEAVLGPGVRKLLANVHSEMQKPAVHSTHGNPSQQHNLSHVRCHECHEMFRSEIVRMQVPSVRTSVPHLQVHQFGAGKAPETTRWSDSWSSFRALRSDTNIKIHSNTQPWANIDNFPSLHRALRRCCSRLAAPCVQECAVACACL